MTWRSPRFGPASTRTANNVNKPSVGDEGACVRATNKPTTPTYLRTEGDSNGIGQAVGTEQHLCTGIRAKLDVLCIGARRDGGQQSSRSRSRRGSQLRSTRERRSSATSRSEQTKHSAYVVWVGWCWRGRARAATPRVRARGERVCVRVGGGRGTKSNSATSAASSGSSFPRTAGTRFTSVKTTRGATRLVDQPGVL